MMKNGGWIRYFWLLFCFNTWLFAADQPALVIGTNVYSPPFVMRGAHDQLFGFDVDITTYICKVLNRTCNYKALPFQDLLQSVESKKVDIAVGSIIITLERAKQVSFTIPYLLSYLRFIGLSKWSVMPFSTALLANKKVGVSYGTIFKQALEQEHIPNLKVIEFEKPASVIQALQNRDVDFALMDEPSANYWEYQTNNLIVPLGEPFLYGYGLGIAVNSNDGELLQKVNSALLMYQNDGGFQKSYNQYIAQF